MFSCFSCDSSRLNDVYRPPAIFMYIYFFSFNLPQVCSNHSDMTVNIPYGCASFVSFSVTRFSCVLFPFDVEEYVSLCMIILHS